MKLPEKFIENVKNTWKKEGSDWLDRLDSLIQHFVEKWQLSDLKLSRNLSYNFIAFANSAKYNSLVVLKICVPTQEFINEQRALFFYSTSPTPKSLNLEIKGDENPAKLKAKPGLGEGCVNLIDYDLENFGMLLKVIEPGISLKKLFPIDDEKATTIAIEVIKKLHRKKPVDLNSYPKINDWLKLLDTFDSDLIPSEHLKAARNLASNLLATQCELYLLHGDLHHENILYDSTENSWLAIDPKGIVGELAYEFGAFIRNPFPELLEQQNAKEIIMQRINQFSKSFDIDKQRIIDWSYVQAILACCWSIQNKSDNWKYWLKVAELINYI